jgi:hypothetical protein
MILKMGADYILTIGKYKHKYLAWVLKYDSEWLIKWAIPACDIPEDIEIVDTCLYVKSELGLDPNMPAFWSEVEILLNKETVEESLRNYDESVPRAPY